MMHFHRSSSYSNSTVTTGGGIDAPSLPLAKKIARKAWGRQAAAEPGVTVRLELRDHNHAPVACLSGRHGDNPAWRKL